MMRLRFAWPLVMGLLLLTACEDPSNVGIGLVDEQGDPVVRSFGTSNFDTTTIDDITGNQPRVLVGQVDDPLTGMISATGYVDFVSPGFDNDDNPTITGVSLVLARNYVYGDTVTTSSISLFDLVEDWTETTAKADTSLPKGMLVTTADFLPSDTLVTIPLPESWIAANDAALRSDEFESSFHGFALEAAGGNAIVGFNESASSLRVFTSADTLNYNLTRTITGLARSGQPAALPPNQVLVQDGLGQTVTFNIDLEDAGLEDTPINGVILRLFADTLVVKDTPPNFVRPLLRDIQLVGVDENGLFLTLGMATLTDDGSYRFREAPLRNVLQQQFFGNALIERLELRFTTSLNTINPMVFYNAIAEERAPVALLTISSSGR